MIEALRRQDGDLFEQLAAGGDGEGAGRVRGLELVPPGGLPVRSPALGAIVRVDLAPREGEDAPEEGGPRVPEDPEDLDGSGGLPEHEGGGRGAGNGGRAIRVEIEHDAWL